MFKNYFKIAWRNIIRNKTTTLINLFGLSVALVAFIFIALWVQNELSFDGYHKDAKDIYLVQMKSNGADEPSSITPLPVAEALSKGSNVAYVARMARWPGTVHVDGNSFDEKTGIFGCQNLGRYTGSAGREKFFTGPPAISCEP